MEGIIYYNIGYKCLVRLAVSISTLRQRHQGNIAIICDKVGYEECKAIADYFKVDILQTNFEEFPGKNVALLNKCRLHQMTPYEKTIFLDSDTIIFRHFPECFQLLDKYEFIVPQFCGWTSRGKQYRKRIERWKGVIPDKLYHHAFDEPKAVNIGFFGWREGAIIFNDWFELALMNRNSFIPDEIACQILLPHVPHLVIGSEYNTSCKHERLTEKAKTLHFHGKKHCRIVGRKYLFHSELWYKEFAKIKALPFVQNNIPHDKMLVSNLQRHCS